MIAPMNAIVAGGTVLKDQQAKYMTLRMLQISFDSAFSTDYFVLSPPTEKIA